MGRHGENGVDVAYRGVYVNNEREILDGHMFDEVHVSTLSEAQLSSFVQLRMNQIKALNGFIDGFKEDIYHFEADVKSVSDEVKFRTDIRIKAEAAVQAIKREEEAAAEVAAKAASPLAGKLEAIKRGFQPADLPLVPPHNPKMARKRSYRRVPKDQQALSGGDVADAIYIVLSDAKEDLHYEEITKRIYEMGCKVSGVNPYKTVGHHVSGDGRFIQKKARSGVWGLKRDD